MQLALVGQQGDGIHGGKRGAKATVLRELLTALRHGGKPHV